MSWQFFFKFSQQFVSSMCLHLQFLYAHQFNNTADSLFFFVTICSFPCGFFSRVFLVNVIVFIQSVRRSLITQLLANGSSEQN